MKRIVCILLMLMFSVCPVLMSGCDEDDTATPEADLSEHLVFTKNDTGYTVELYSLEYIIGYESVDAFREANVDKLSITKITIPSTYNGEPVTKIGGYAFAYTGIVSVNIPDSVTEIGECAFLGCSSLADISLPSTLEMIGERAFYECSSLTEIFLPKQISHIGLNAFYGCSSLTVAYYYASEAVLIDDVRIYGGNSPLTSVLCYYSSDRPTTNGSFWHYGPDNLPVKW
ncbi:MAG: leucine-rich repeat domain-containing protein [Clostridia bacterium]|nr:leucine-rich repeat domain-containing protein [Clostridia bacterium]